MAQHHEAQRKGWRAFLAVPEGEQWPSDAVRCPYDTHGVTCATFQLCQGTERNARSIWIEAHGAVGRNLPAVSTGGMRDV